MGHTPGEIIVDGKSSGTDTIKDSEHAGISQSSIRSLRS